MAVPWVWNALLWCVQAALEIRQLKDTVADGEGRIKELVQQVSLMLLLEAWLLIGLRQSLASKNV